MNEEIEKAMNALAGDGTAGGTSSGGDGTDWKAKCKELENKLNAVWADEGRAKKLAEEVKELRKQLAGAEALKRAKEEVANLGEETRGDVPEDYLVGAGVLAQKMAADAIAEKSAELDRRIAEREERERAARQQQFAERIDRQFPGFLRDAVSDTGDKHAAWVQYQRYNAPSIVAATRNFDFESLSWHIQQFYTNALGIAAPSGGTGAAAPDPSPTGGVNQAHRTAGKPYTEDEIDALFDKKEAARDRGDWAEVRRLTDEINRAQAEVDARK